MRPITDILREYRKGRLVEQATDELAAIVKAVEETGKAGKLTLKISVRKKDNGEVILQAETKAEVPKEPLPDAIFYTDANGDLHRVDPRQREMPFENARQHQA